MELIRAAAALSVQTDGWRAAGDTVALVPTLGALHEGHRSLIRRARSEHRRVVVSIFLNPTQFGDREDLERYPRDEPADVAVCEDEGVDAVWAPQVEEVYPLGASLARPSPGLVGDLYEGAARPGHFAGVLQVVHRLLDVVGPCAAYFGEKDAQQLFLVRRMVSREPELCVEIVACPTLRAPDGLALSSRNAFLSPEERAQATCLFLALAEAAERAKNGERNADVLVAVMAREIGATPLARLDYAAVVSEETFEPVGTIAEPARAIVAARFPSARLLDNLRLPEPA
jgi:pantoate--beta-alanine ligase